MISVLKVCDTFLKYGLPLMVMPPPGVFYPALLATDPVSVDRLAYIMYRWEYLLLVLHTLMHVLASSPFIFFFHLVFCPTLYSSSVWFIIHSIKANSSDIVFFFFLVDINVPQWSDITQHISYFWGILQTPCQKYCSWRAKKTHTTLSRLCIFGCRRE